MNTAPRHLKTVYLLIWQGEEVDEFDTYEEAKKMRYEYNMAFNGGVWIKRTRRRVDNPD